MLWIQLRKCMENILAGTIRSHGRNGNVAAAVCCGIQIPIGRIRWKRFAYGKVHIIPNGLEALGKIWSALPGDPDSLGFWRNVDIIKIIVLQQSVAFQKCENLLQMVGCMIVVRNGSGDCNGLHPVIDRFTGSCESTGIHNIVSQIQPSVHTGNYQIEVQIQTGTSKPHTVSGGRINSPDGYIIR